MEAGPYPSQEGRKLLLTPPHTLTLILQLFTAAQPTLPPPHTHTYTYTHHTTPLLILIHTHTCFIPPHLYHTFHTHTHTHTYPHLTPTQNEGVRVYIQLYKEVLLAIDLGSEFVTQVLKHPNIVVSGGSLQHSYHPSLTASLATSIYMASSHEINSHEINSQLPIDQLPTRSTPIKPTSHEIIFA